MTKKEDEITKLKAECFDLDNNLNYLNEEKRKRLIRLQQLITEQNENKKESVKKEKIFKEGEKNVK